MPEPASKRVLLVHPLGYNKAHASSDISRRANIMPPLGLASIAAYLEQKGIGADIIDSFAHPDSDSKIIARIGEARPGWLGLSCTTSGYLDAIRIAAMVKGVYPWIKTVFGGAHVSALREKLLQGNDGVVDFAVVGEGEETLAELVNLDGGDPGRIAGLVYRDPAGQARFSGFRQHAIALDDLPFPAYEKLEGYPQAYQLPIFNYPRTPNASCISSRGCPYACSYCDRSVFRKSFRFNSADYLYRHLKYLNERFAIRHINFYDDLFTFNRSRVESFCRLMIDGSLGMTFNCAVRAEHVNPELLKLMKAAGCWMISLGIETGDEQLLKRHRQNVDLRMLAQTIRDIKKAGIRVKGLLMMGLPGESEETIKNSMKYVFSLPIDDFNLAKFTPFPGSPLYEHIHEMGEFDENIADMDCMHFVFVPAGMKRERLEELFIKFYKTHFMRPSVLWGYVTMIWKSPDSWRRFLGSLTSFVKFARSNKRLAGSK
jgi:anaerobic magnesium-protoporphyrin IX monomethyl ester cyclase